MIIKEVEKRVTHIDLPGDFEDRMCDIAIETLSDITECNNSRVYVKWVILAQKKVALLYILFSGKASENMPKVHIDELGEMHPAHAICLMSMPSGQLMTNDKIKSVIRKGVEEFLLKFKVKD